MQNSESGIEASVNSSWADYAAGRGGRLLTPFEVAEILRTGLDYVMNAIKHGKLPLAIQEASGRYLISESDLETLANAPKISENGIKAQDVKNTRQVHSGLAEFAAEYELSAQQLSNYYHWLVQAGIRPAHRHKRRMSYDAVDNLLFANFKALRKAGMPVMDALAESVGNVLGETYQQRLVEWYTNYENKNRNQRGYKKRLIIAEKRLSAADNIDGEVGHLALKTQMLLLGSDNERVASAVRESLLEHLVDDRLKMENNEMNSYPLNLYLALNGAKWWQNRKRAYGSERLSDEIRQAVAIATSAAVKAGMKRTAVEESFEAYEQKVYRHVSEFWNMVADAVRQPLGTAFERAIEEHGAFSEPWPRDSNSGRTHGNNTKALAVAGARYDGGKQTLEEIDRYLGVTKERVRQFENKGLALIRGISDASPLGCNVLYSCMQHFGKAYGIEEYINAELSNLLLFNAAASSGKIIFAPEKKRAVTSYAAPRRHYVPNTSPRALRQTIKALKNLQPVA
ncbi:hypothetical protein HYU12_00350 [Candidatus Woesearchaeota archaeon]|nr:hypothetical protein [Candidatus Woesearchaeota archaeon]